MDESSNGQRRPASEATEERTGAGRRPRVARPGVPVEGSARATSVLLFMLSFLLAPFGLTFLLAVFPDGAPWWLPVGLMLITAGVIGLRKRAAGLGVAAGTLVWIGLLVWITNFVD